MVKNGDSLEVAYVILFMGWVLYFVVHSLLASSTVKNWAQFHLKKGYKYYRITYSLISTLGLFIMLLINATIEPSVLLAKSSFTNYVSLMLAAFGTIIISRSFKSYSFKEFIGLDRERNRNLRTDGILNYVRHPIYLGTVLIVSGYWFFSPTLATSITTLVIFTYLPIGMALEEKKLIKTFGEDYLEYKRRVPAIFPRLKR